MKNAEKTIKELIDKNKWIETEREFFGVPNHRYHFDKININKLREETK